MPLVARVAIGLSVALIAAGCASMKEVQLDPAVREKLARGPPIHVVHFVPMPLDFIRSALEPRDVYYDVAGVDDPVADVERAFLDALLEELGLSNLHPSDRPVWSQERMLPRGVTLERASAHGAPVPMTAWPAAWYRDGFLLEFETLNWHIDNSGPKRLVGRCTLFFGLRARLLRLSDDTVLWRGFCEFKNPRQCGEFVADDLKLVKELRPEIAKRCAMDLRGSFMGRTETTFWGGLNKPKKEPR
jgi:hypothetical protein